MKVFVAPEVEIVNFDQRNIITASPPCLCVDCVVCPPGSNDCKYYDTCPKHVCTTDQY